MKILHLIDSGGLYGAEKMLLSLVSQQVIKGLSPLILSVGEPNVTEKKIETEAIRLNLPIKIWRMTPGLNLKEASKIKSWAQENGFEILHSHGFKFNVLMGLLGVRNTIPLVTTLHGYIKAPRFTKAWIYEVLDRFALSRINGIVTVSESIAQEIPLFCKKSKLVRTINNGLFLEGIKIESEAALSEKELEFFVNHNPVILGVGRLSKEKGFEHLISAFKRIRELWPNAGLLIAGEGPSRDALTEILISSKLESSVLMPGYCENVPSIMSRSSLLVISSSTEGLPITLLEALVARLPVVATDVGEIPYVLNDGECGLLIGSGQNLESKIFDSIIRILGDRFESERRSEIGYNRVFEKFSSESMERSYCEFYREVLGLPPVV